MSNLKFAETHNLVMFLEKPKESNGFEGIIDFLNASSIRYALTVNPTIYTSCIKQFWATAKAKTVNGEVQIQALVMGRRTRKNGAPEELGEGSEIPIDTQHTPTIIQPSTSQPQKKKPRRKQMKNTKVPQPSGSTEPITDSYNYEQAGGSLLRYKEKIAGILMLSEGLSATTTTVDELTLAQTFIEIKSAKPKAITTAASTTTTAITRPKARGVEVKEPNYELAQRLQAEEQGELTIEERSKLFVELMDKRKKHFAKLKAEEIRKTTNQSPKEESNMLFDNTIKWVDSFVPKDTKVVKGSKSQAEGSSKRTGEELESDNSKKQKIDENVEAEVDDEAEMKKLMEIVPDDENIDKEDLETLWKLDKAKHGNIRPKEAYGRVSWGDLKVMLKMM
ncbi:hypothetical protein Tco_0693698 [Tanacetum coccineum]